MYEPLDDTAAQVLLAVETGDSIRRVSQQLQRPYETVRQAVDRLEAAGFIEYEDGLAVVDEGVREAALSLLASSAGASPPTVDEAYVLPQFGDWPFAFARIDGVFVWTQGGYQVSRNDDDYPLFLAVRERDVEDWRAFFERFGLPVAFERQPRESLDGPVQYVIDSRPELEVEHVEGHPVVPREETIDYMREHYAHFQSALSMMDRLYEDLDLDVSYHERERIES